MAKKAHVSEEKKEVVNNLVNLIKKYPVIAALDMENMPASPLQLMRAQLRDKVEMTMTKRRIMKIAFEQAKDSKKDIEKLVPHLKGMPALIFTNESPFKLSKILKKSRSPAPAKAGQIAPRDLIVNKGSTPFAPGPIISELAMAGIKSGVEQGKVAIKEDAVVAKKGEKIKPKVAEILTRLGIQPMEVGLTITAAYENGLVYDQEVLDIDEQGTLGKIGQASAQALNLAVFTSYPAKDTIELLLSKAFNEAKALGISQNIIDKGIIDVLLARAEASMLSLKGTANIEVIEKPKEEPKPEVKEEPKEKKEEKPKIEEKKDEPKKAKEKKPEPKKEAPKPEAKEDKKPGPKETSEEIEKKEEKVLEEEKEIIKEEKKLEKEEKKIDAPVEEEAEKEVKEEEEKKLEEERIQKEKEFEKLEKEKEEKRIAEEKKKKEEAAKLKEKQELEKKEERVLEEEKKIIEEEKELEKEKPEGTPIEKEVQTELKEEEEKKLEKERIKKEKQFEGLEKKKDATDIKVEEMVEQIKKHGKVKEPTAQQIIEEVKKEEPEKKVKKHDDVKQVENLFEELKKKGTLRK